MRSLHHEGGRDLRLSLHLGAEGVSDGGAAADLDQFELAGDRNGTGSVEELHVPAAVAGIAHPSGCLWSADHSELATGAPGPGDAEGCVFPLPDVAYAHLLFGDAQGAQVLAEVSTVRCDGRVRIGRSAQALGVVELSVQEALAGVVVPVRIVLDGEEVEGLLGASVHRAAFAADGALVCVEVASDPAVADEQAAIGVGGLLQEAAQCLVLTFLRIADELGLSQHVG